MNTYGYDISFGTFSSYLNQTTFKHLTTKDYDILLAVIVRNHYPQYAQELEGIVEVFNRSDIKFEYVSALVISIKLVILMKLLINYSLKLDLQPFSNMELYHSKKIGDMVTKFNFRIYQNF